MVNALAQRRLDEARLTNAERMEARMRGRVRVAGSASLGGGDGDGGRGDDTDTDTDTESESDVDGSGNGNGDGDGDGIGPKNGPVASPRKASRPSRSFFRAFLSGFSPTDRSPRSPRFPRGEEDGHRRRRRSSSHHQTGRKSRLHGKPSGRKSKFWRRPARLLAKTKIRFRRFAARVVEHEDFEALVVLAIFVNCVSLALYRPLENTDPGDSSGSSGSTSSSWNDNLDTLELALNVFFTLELFLRCAVAGVKKYVNDPWNKFDFFLVVVGYGGVFAEAIVANSDGDSNSDATQTSAFRALRALRALRPLRTITRFESLRSVVVCFVEAVPLLVSVCGLVCFFAFVFAVAGQHLFLEAYHQRCEDPNTGVPEFRENDEFGCAIGGRAGVARYGRVCPSRDGRVSSGSDESNALTNLACVVTDSGRGHSVAGYDNVGLGMLTVFQCTTLAGWAQVMYRVMDSGAELAVPYFVALVFFGSYFVVNLFLAVLKSKFGRAQSLFQAKLARSSSSLREPDDGRTQVSRDDENLVGTQAKVRKTTHEEGRVDGRSNAKGTTEEAFGDDVDDVGAPGSIATKSQRASRKANTVATLVFSANRRISRWVHARRLEAERKEARLAQSLEASLGCDPDEADDAERGGGGSLVALDEDEEKKMRAGDLRSLDRRRRWVEFKELCREMAEHPRFNTFFLFLICLNTATMAVEHHGMDDDLAFFLVVANACFTAFFFLEVSVKLVGLGAWHFFSDAFNRFDFLIVSLAVVETVAVAVYGGYDNGGHESGGHDGGDGDDSNIVSAMRGLKVLRTFRVFKMFRYLSSLRVIGEVLLSSLSSFMSIAALLCLFTIVFSIVGLHVFGGMNTDPDSQFKYGVDDPQLGGRAGFDTFYHSALTVFQVLTLEDWEFIMFKSVAYAGWSACFFFVSWVIVGKYTFLTLFLAVTMEAFESKYDAHAGEEARAVAELVRKKRARRRKRFAELRRRKKEKEKKLKALKAAEERKEEGGHKEDGSSARTKNARDKKEANADSPSRVVTEVRFDSTGDADETFFASGSGSVPDSKRKGVAVPIPVSIPSGSASPSSPYSGSSTPGGGFTEYDKYYGRSLSGYDSGSITPSALSSGSATPSHRWRGGLDGLESVVGSARPSGFQFASSSSSMMHAHKSARNNAATTRANKAKDLAEWSCFCVPPHHKWREFAYDVVKHPAFERFFFLLIGVSCVVMALERPGMDETLERNLKRVDFVLACCFFFEVALKCFAFGVKRYLREKVNRLDMCIALFTVLEICLVSVFSGLSAIRSLRILRAIRPLRALTKSHGMRLVLKSVALSMGAMVNVSAVLLLVFAVFGILGVQIFAGRFYRCDDPFVEFRAECVGTYVEPVTGITKNRSWTNAYLNFDSLPNALVSLFVASTLDGYGQLLFDGLDATNIDEQPRRDANPAAFAFFLAFIVLCAFSLLNLYVGVIFYQFSRIRTLSQTSSLDLSEAQKEWGEMCKTVLRMRQKKKMPLPKNPLRRLPYRIASHEKFEKVVFAALVAAAVVVATRTRDEPLYVAELRNEIEVFFFVVFLLEAFLKITALGFRAYWRESWNRFDLMCVFFSFLDVAGGAILFSARRRASHDDTYVGVDAYEYLTEHDHDASTVTHYDYDERLYRAHVYRLSGPVTNRMTAERFLGLAKVLRLIRLVKHLKGLRDLLETLVASLAAFWNVGALVALLFFIYAYVGVILFGTTLSDTLNDVTVTETETGGLNEHANFENFPRAVLTLFRVATNDEWVGVMRDCAGDEITGLFSYPFFVSFVVLVSMVMLNLFTAVIIENFENCQDHEHWKVSPNALRPFVDAFHKFDDGSGTVRGVDLEKLLREIPPPLGLGGGNGGASARINIGGASKKKEEQKERHSPSGGSMLVVHFIKSLNVPLDARGRAPFRRTAFELVRRVCECDMPPGDMRDALEHAVRRAFPDLWEPIPDEMSWAALMCVVRVQRHWRARVAKRAETEKRRKEAEKRRSRFLEKEADKAEKAEKRNRFSSVSGSSSRRASFLQTKKAAASRLGSVIATIGGGALEALEWGRHKSVAENSGETRSNVSSAHQNQPRRAVSSFSRLTLAVNSSRRGSNAVTKQGRSMSSKASHVGLEVVSNGTQAPFSAFFGKGKVAPAETLPVASPDGTVPRY